MLAKIVELSLRLRGVVLAVACCVAAYGAYVAKRTPLDVFPEFTSPQVVVQTEAPGLSAEQVEQLVTRPVENELNGTPDLESIRSESIQGLSAITLTFAETADIYRSRQLVGEHLAEVAGDLPQGVSAPKMGALTSSTGLFLVVGLTSSERSPMDVRTFAEWTLRPRLLGVKGVSRVDLFGGDRRQLQIQVKPDRLLAFGLSTTDVLDAAGRATGVRGAGFVENANQRIVIHTEGQSLTPAQIAEVVLKPGNNANVRIGDVAAVAAAAEPKFGDALVMGEPGVILLAWSQYGVNTLEVTAATEAALHEMEPALRAEKIELHPRLFRPATFIENSLANINQSLIIGGVLVAAVLLLFLLDLRSAFASFVSIPLSLLAAVIVLHAAGASLNTISLGGFAIAIGVVVDDAIIDVENILRRVREYLAAPGRNMAGAGPLQRVVLDASLEVRSAVVYATFIVALVFVPVLTMSGVQGRLFAPLAVSFILATLGSLVVALTVTPALCYVLFRNVQPHAEPGYIRRLKAFHRRLVRDAVRHAPTIVGAALGLFFVALLSLPFLGGEFLPEFHEGHFIVHMIALPGTSLAESLRMGKQVTAELLKNRHISSVSHQAGRAEGGEDTWGTHLSEFHVGLAPMNAAEAEQVGGEIRETLHHFPGLAFNVMPFLTERMEETISGATATLVINIFGDDLESIDRKASEVYRVLAAVPGAVDVGIESQPGLPELSVKLRRDRLEQLGFNPLDVLDTVRTAYQGTVAAQIYEGNRVYDVAVILDEESRREPEAIGGLLVDNGSGLRVPLRELADVAVTRGRYMIVREGAQRRQQVTANVEGRDGASFLIDVKKAVAAGIELPAGTYMTYGGSAEAQAEARRELFIHSLIAGVGVVLLLGIAFSTGRNLLLVLTNLPFAMIGGLLAVLASGADVSIGTLVGFVTLFGITMRNSIMLVSHYEHLVVHEGMTWGLEAAVRGASERLVPILMTALVTALGLLPLAIGSGEPGREIEGPMAIVILGGLLTSTVLNLIVLPTLAVRFASFAHSSEMARAEV